MNYQRVNKVLSNLNNTIRGKESLLQSIRESREECNEVSEKAVLYAMEMFIDVNLIELNAIRKDLSIALGEEE